MNKIGYSATKLFGIKLKEAWITLKDNQGNVHETIFHFVKILRNTSTVLTKSGLSHDSKVVNGSIKSATGVSGVKYKRKIELSTELTDEEKIMHSKH